MLFCGAPTGGGGTGAAGPRGAQQGISVYSVESNGEMVVDSLSPRRQGPVAYWHPRLRWDAHWASLQTAIGAPCFAKFFFDTGIFDHAHKQRLQLLSRLELYK